MTVVLKVVATYLLYHIIGDASPDSDDPGKLPQRLDRTAALSATCGQQLCHALQYWNVAGHGRKP